MYVWVSSIFRSLHSSLHTLLAFMCLIPVAVECFPTRTTRAAQHQVRKSSQWFDQHPLSFSCKNCGKRVLWRLGNHAVPEEEAASKLQSILDILHWHAKTIAFDLASKHLEAWLFPWKTWRVLYVKLHATLMILVRPYAYPSERQCKRGPITG